jgi:hypothetical protein
LFFQFFSSLCFNKTLFLTATSYNLFRQFNLVKRGGNGGGNAAAMLLRVPLDATAAADLLNLGHSRVAFVVNFGLPSNSLPAAPPADAVAAAGLAPQQPAVVAATPPIRAHIGDIMQQR